MTSAEAVRFICLCGSRGALSWSEDWVCPDCGADVEPTLCQGHLAVDCGRYDDPIGEIVYCDGSCAP